MSTSPLTDVHAFARLVGVWQFAARDVAWFGALARDEGATVTQFAIGPLDVATPAVKITEDDDLSVRAIDARAIGDELVLALEINRSRALQLARVPLAALTDGSVAAAAFNGQQDLNLSDADAEDVRLPPDRLWNVASSLKTTRWLFSPRLTRGATPRAEVVANTADGRIVVLDAASDRVSTIVGPPGAAEPQACRFADRRILAFKAQAEPGYVPFWSLPRYSVERPARTGALTIIDGDVTIDLSKELELGPVVAFALETDAAGAPWLFALRDARGGRGVTALQRTDRRWVVAGEWNVAVAADIISAAPARQGWRLLYGIGSASGWSLKQQVWTER